MLYKTDGQEGAPIDDCVFFLHIFAPVGHHNIRDTHFMSNLRTLRGAVYGGGRDCECMCVYVFICVHHIFHNCKRMRRGGLFLRCTAVESMLAMDVAWNIYKYSNVRTGWFRFCVRACVWVCGVRAFAGVPQRMSVCAHTSDKDGTTVFTGERRARCSRRTTQL